MRSEIFRRNYQKIQSHNSMKNVSYKLAVNKFADWTQEERAKLRGVKKVNKTKKTDLKIKQDIEQVGLPSYIDWREWGGVTPVQDQGQCNTCWAFATTAAMEGSYFSAHGKLLKYSEQMMEDCCFGEDCGDRDPGCYHGGCIHCALEWM